MRKKLAWMGLVLLLAAGCRGQMPMGVITPTLAPNWQGTTSSILATKGVPTQQWYGLPTPTPAGSQRPGTLPPTLAITLTIDAFMLTDVTLPATATSRVSLASPTPVMPMTPSPLPTLPATLTPAATAVAMATRAPAVTRPPIVSPMPTGTAPGVSATAAVTGRPPDGQRATLTDRDLFETQGTPLTPGSTATLVPEQLLVQATTARPPSTLTQGPPSTPGPAAIVPTAAVQPGSPSRIPATTTPAGASRAVVVAVGTGTTAPLPAPKTTDIGAPLVEDRATPQPAGGQPAVSRQYGLDLKLLADWRRRLPSVPPPPQALSAEWPVYDASGQPAGTINPGSPCRGCHVGNWPYDWDHKPPSMAPGLAVALAKKGQLPILYFRTSYPGTDVFTIWTETVEGVTAVTIVPGVGAFQGALCFDLSPKACGR